VIPGYHLKKQSIMKSQILLVLAILCLNQQNAILQPVEKNREESRNETARSFLSTPELFGVESTESSYIDWANLQWPPTANIAAGGSMTVYVRTYEEDVTKNAGSDARISVWIGYNSSNTNPNTWSNWIKANFNSQYDWSDEYMASIGNTLPAGIYYYASRIQYDGGSYLFGGYNTAGGGFWDGVNNVSGILTVGKQLATITLSNTLQLYDGKPKQVTAVTSPAGLTVKILYNGSSALPVDAGSYTVTATIDNASYQGTQTGALSIYTVPKDEASISLRNKFIWVMYDQVWTQSDLTAALSCKPDVINRGWFKWGGTGGFSWTTWNWMAQQSNQQNAIFGGGGTVIALYPGEVNNEKFQRIVDRTVLNEPMPFAMDPSFDFFNGDLQKREYLNFLLDWIFDQIDAGANTLHLDGIADGPSFGFSDSCMVGFNDYLIGKYVDHDGWTVSDSRWQSIFDINFSNDCTDGTIRTFDYRKFLVRNGYESNPFQYQFPLGKEFGYPWDYAGTYADIRNKESCRYLYESIKEYAAKKGLDVSVTTNGSSNYVDYQTTGVWNNWSVSGGRLNIAPSYTGKWREIKDYSMINLHHDIPLIVFHDWGFGMPFYSEIPVADQILWLRVYAPEVFASGAVFAWPFSGGGNNYQPVKAVLDTMQSLIRWYSSNRDLYIGSEWISDKQVNLKGQSSIVQTLLDQYDEQRNTLKRIVHLINKKLDGNRNLVNRENFNIRVFSGEKPTSVWAVSPDFIDCQRLDYTWAGDTAEITVKYLEAYSVVVLDYLNKVPQKIYFNEIPDRTQGDPDYDPQAYSSSGLPVTYLSSDPGIATIVGGKVHMVAPGSCTITASQPGNASYEAAQDVSRILVVIEITAEMEIMNSTLQIFPNPCNDFIYIKSAEPWPFKVLLMDILGKIYFNGYTENNSLEVKGLPPGVYIINTNGSVRKVIIQ
jgi:hypothetical protein